MKAWRGRRARLAVADYTYDSLPPQERGSLPTATELTAALERSGLPAGAGPCSRSVPKDLRSAGSHKDGSNGNRAAAGRSVRRAALRRPVGGFLYRTCEF